MYCSKEVAVVRGRLSSHVTAGNQKCLGIGLLAAQSQNQLRLIQAARKERK